MCDVLHILTKGRTGARDLVKKLPNNVKKESEENITSLGEWRHIHITWGESKYKNVFSKYKLLPYNAK